MADENLIQTYAVNMVPDGIPPVIHVSQYDAGLRTLRFILYSGTQKLVLPANAIVTLSGGKPDGTIYEYQMNKVDDSTVQIPVQAQMTAVAGWHSAEIVVYDGESVTGSCNIRIKVEKSPSENRYVPSVSESDLLNDAKTAGANAQIYRDQAQASAAAAANSERNSKSSETNSNASEKATKGYRDEAEEFRNQAAGYAGAAVNTIMTDSDGYICLDHKESNA